MSIEKVLKFAQCINELRLVTRTIRANTEDRFENDTEHSYALAMLAWYIIDSEKLPLDLFKVLKYCLAHDFLEIYAGDTYVYATRDVQETKHEREKNARKKLKENFPEMPDLHNIIDGYEERTDIESKFVYALDKLQPVITIYLDDGRTWNELKLTLDFIIKHKSEKISISPEVEKYWSEFVKILKTKEKELFTSI